MTPRPISPPPPLRAVTDLEYRLRPGQSATIANLITVSFVQLNPDGSAQLKLTRE